jgi:hypothetical protein
MDHLQPRHIQNDSDAQYLEHHWGYVDRALPCTNDEGTCEYLDAIYWMFDTSMLYTFIMWAVIGGLLLIMLGMRFAAPSSRPARDSSSDQVVAERQRPRMGSSYYRAWRASAGALRKYLLPESLKGLFGNVTRLQLVAFAGLSIYLIIFS